MFHRCVTIQFTVIKTICFCIPQMPDHLTAVRMTATTTHTRKKKIPTPNQYVHNSAYNHTYRPTDYNYITYVKFTCDARAHSRFAFVARTNKHTHTRNKCVNVYTRHMCVMCACNVHAEKYANNGLGVCVQCVSIQCKLHLGDLYTTACVCAFFLFILWYSFTTVLWTGVRFSISTHF